MTMTTDTKQTCRRCGKPLFSDHGVPYCMVHGEQSPAPTVEPIKPHGKKKPAGVQGAAGTVEDSAQKAGPAPTDPPAASGQPAADPPLPARPITGGNKAMHRYYEANKDLIIRSYKVHGFKAAEILKINTSQLRKLLYRWDIPIIHPRKAASLSKTKLKLRKLPPFVPPP